MPGHRSVWIIHHSHREPLVGNVAPDAFLINGSQRILIAPPRKIHVVTHFKPGEYLDVAFAAEIELIEIIGIILENAPLPIIPSGQIIAHIAGAAG